MKDYEVSYEYPLGSGSARKLLVVSDSLENAISLTGIRNPTLRAILVEKPKLISSATKSYIEKILSSRTPEEYFVEQQSFRALCERCLSDEGFQLTFSANDEITEEFRTEYERRSGKFLPEKRLVDNKVLPETQGNKRNVIVSEKTIGDLQFIGIHFKPFFGGPLLVGHGDRQGLWWAMVDAGFCIGHLKDQDVNSILGRLTSSVLEA